MPNPNEIQRKLDELEEHRNIMRGLKAPKRDREYSLGRIQILCRELGIMQPPKYNGGK